MLSFIVKSVISSALSYGFYHLFLRNVKAYKVTRFFLLYTLLISLFIPFITIQINADFPLHSNLHELSDITGGITNLEDGIIEQSYFQSLKNYVKVVYLIISSIFLVRFIVNIHRLFWQIRTSSIWKLDRTKLVLIEEELMPYSFFKYIFINNSDYKDGRIEKELIIHEQTHCLQYHSIDILVVELIKIIQWFNPFVWLFKKAIQLNHEYLADDRVILSQDLYEYQNTLVAHAYRNSSTFLASNFSYSTTKKRLLMMNKKSNNNRIYIRKIALIPVISLLLINLSFTQKKPLIAQFETKDVNNPYQQKSAGEQTGATIEQSPAFQEALLKERSAAAKEQSAHFQEGLLKERSAAAKEQSAHFQEGLLNERNAAGMDRKNHTGKQLEEEQRAAIEGTIVVDDPR